MTCLVLTCLFCNGMRCSVLTSLFWQWNEVFNADMFGFAVERGVQC